MKAKLLLMKDGTSFYVKDPSKDYHTKFGFIKSADLQKQGKLATSNKGFGFFVLDAGFIDTYKKKKRAAQIILPKDIGYIIAETGINSQSRVLDAGGGSGGLSTFLAHLCKEVISYEKRKDFVKVIEYNKALLGLDNLSVKLKDIYEGIDEKNLDLVVLDLPEPVHALAPISKALKSGAFLVIYLTNITQITELVNSLEDQSEFVYLKTIELLEREWKIKGKIARPEFRMLGHTGFLTFVRKI